MIIGNKNFGLWLSKIAFNFRGGAPLDYLETQSVKRILELNDHLKVIGQELENNG